MPCAAVDQALYRLCIIRGDAFAFRIPSRTAKPHGQVAEPFFVLRCIRWNGAHTRDTSLHTLAESARRQKSNPWQRDELVHASGE